MTSSRVACHYMQETRRGHTWKDVRWRSGNLLNRDNAPVGVKSLGYIFFRYAFMQTANKQSSSFPRAAYVGHFGGWSYLGVVTVSSQKAELLRFKMSLKLCAVAGLFALCALVTEAKLMVGVAKVNGMFLLLLTKVWVREA